MFKLLIWIALGYLIYRSLKAWKGNAARPSGRMENSDHPQVDDEMVKDPVCQTYFPKRNGVTATVAGQEIYFCSDACRDRYLSRPPKGPAS